MGSVFCTDVVRKIYVASQNRFASPIRHPSRTLSEHIISYVVRGGWVLDVNHERLYAEKDCVFIQPAHIPHIGIELCPPDTQTLFVHFSSEQGDRVVTADTHKVEENELYLPHLIDASRSPSVKKTLLRIVEENMQNNAIKAAAYLNVLLAELGECLPYQISRNVLGKNIKRLIDGDLSERLSNAALAERLGVSVRTVETAFKESWGISIHQYRMVARLQRAKFLLEYYPEMKLIEIALTLGFYDEYHFSRQFKQKIGCSPSDYRALHTISAEPSALRRVSSLRTQED